MPSTHENSVLKLEKILEQLACINEEKVDLKKLSTKMKSISKSLDTITIPPNNHDQTDEINQMNQKILSSIIKIQKRITPTSLIETHKLKSTCDKNKIQLAINILLESISNKNYYSNIDDKLLEQKEAEEFRILFPDKIVEILNYSEQESNNFNQAIINLIQLRNKIFSSKKKEILNEAQNNIESVFENINERMKAINFLAETILANKDHTRNKCEMNIEDNYFSTTFDVSEMVIVKAFLDKLKSKSYTKQELADIINNNYDYTRDWQNNTDYTINELTESNVDHELKNKGLILLYKNLRRTDFYWNYKDIINSHLLITHHTISPVSKKWNKEEIAKKMKIIDNICKAKEQLTSIENEIIKEFQTMYPKNKKVHKNVQSQNKRITYLMAETLIKQRKVKKNLQLTEDNPNHSLLNIFKPSQHNGIEELYNDCAEMYEKYLEIYKEIKSEDNDKKLIDELITQLQLNRKSNSQQLTTKKLLDKIESSNLSNDKAIKKIIAFCKNHNTQQNALNSKKIKFYFTDIDVSNQTKKVKKTLKMTAYFLIASIVLTTGIAYFAGSLSYASVLAAVKSGPQALKVSLRSFFSLKPVNFMNINIVDHGTTVLAKTGLVYALFNGLNLLINRAIKVSGVQTLIEIKELNRNTLIEIKELNKSIIDSLDNLKDSSKPK